MHFILQIGRVDLAFVLDCEEHFLQQRLLLRGKDTGRADDNAHAIASRITAFKQNTLPAIKYWDDKGKLVIVSSFHVYINKLLFTNYHMYSAINS